jgi:hypothetical protein
MLEKMQEALAAASAAQADAEVTVERLKTFGSTIAEYDLFLERRNKEIQAIMDKEFSEIRGGIQELKVAVNAMVAILEGAPPSKP